MAFRARTNRHDWWRQVIAENADLIGFLPPTVYAREEDFRTFMKEGELPGPAGELAARMQSLSDQEITALSTLVHHRVAFDMDVLLFDTFNAEWEKRRLR